MDYRIFNMCTNVNACNCTQGCSDTRKRVCTESWLWEKNPLPHWGIEPASAVWWSDALTNWATSPSSHAGKPWFDVILIQCTSTASGYLYTWLILRTAVESAKSSKGKLLFGSDEVILAAACHVKKWKEISDFWWYFCLKKRKVDGMIRYSCVYVVYTYGYCRFLNLNTVIPSKLINRMWKYPWNWKRGWS